MTLEKLADAVTFDQIEDIRRDNNALWIDVLRLAFRVAPDEARAIFRKINKNDQEISKLFSSLT